MNTAFFFGILNHMKPIARREVVIVDRNSNQEQHIVFEIMPPYSIDDGDNYMCTARISGDVNESFEVGGADSLQALMLAIQCLDIHYEEMKKNQYDFFWPDRTNPMKSFDLVKDDIQRFYKM